MCCQLEKISEYDPQLGIHWGATCAQNPHKTSRNFLSGDGRASHRASTRGHG
jgi:hypothetical protein